MKELIILICIFGVIIGAALGLVFWVNPIICEQQSVSFENHRWGYFSGCMVKHKGAWIPLDNIRGFD